MKFIDTVRRNLILVTTESERVTYRKLINMGQGKTLGFPGGCKACLRCKTVISYVARNDPPPSTGGGIYRGTTIGEENKLKFMR